MYDQYHWKIAKHFALVEDQVWDTWVNEAELSEDCEERQAARRELIRAFDRACLTIGFDGSLASVRLPQMVQSGYRKYLIPDWMKNTLEMRALEARK